jgi:photosystem II stability/assembly factor-like uncharacterized protein
MTSLQNPWLFRVLLFFSFFNAPSMCLAQWTASNTGRYGGTPTDFIAKGNDIYMTSQGGGIHKSTDSGVTWTQVSNGLGYNKNVYCLALKGDSILAGNHTTGVMYSANNGASWTSLTANLTMNNQVTDLVVFGKNIFAATGGGVYKSTNGGTSWVAINSGLPTTGSFSLLTQASGIFYLGVYSQGLYRSTDLGATWSRVTSIPDNATISSLLAYNGSLYVGGSTGLLISNDNGVTWTTTGTGLPGDAAMKLASKGSNLYAGANMGLHVSADNGATFSLMTHPATLPYGGRNVGSIASIGNQLLIGFQSRGVYRSSDGSTLEESNTGFNGLTVGNFLSSGNKLYVTGGATHVSSDNGSTWSVLKTSPLDLVFDVALRGDSILARTNVNGTRLSLDNGATWSTKAYSSMTILSTSGQQFYGYNNNTGLARLTPFAPDWNIIFPQTPSDQFLDVIENGQKIVARGYPNFYFTDNGGDTWAMKSTGLPGTSVATDIMLHKNKYYLVRNEGIFVTSNFGDSWTLIQMPQYLSLLRLASDGHHIFAAGYIGVFFSNDDGSTFYDINDDVSKAVTPKDIFRSNGRLFIGGDDGVWSTNQSLEHSITSFTPAYGKVGESISITGKYFSLNPAYRKVFVNGVEAAVTEATTTSLRITVPAGATTGKLSVTVNGRTVESQQSYCAGMTDPFATMTNTDTGFPLLSSNNTNGNQWFLNGQPIAGATGQTYAVTQPGLYSLQVSNGPCTTEMSNEFLITDVEEFSQVSQLSVYPVPSSDELKIDLYEFNAQLPVTITLVNALGQKELTTEFPGGTSARINITNLPQGVYLVRASQNERSGMKRVVIQR